MKWDSFSTEPCPVARTVAVIGDRWTLLLLRDCFLGVRRFEDFQSRLGISRTIITHLCTQMMVLSIFFFGGPSLHFFALALTVGILFGIYSSVLVACPLAKYLGASRADFVKPEKKAVEPVVP